MGRWTYWQGRGPSIACTHWAMRAAAVSLAMWAAVSKCGKARRAYPPERRAFPLNERRTVPRRAAEAASLHWLGGGEAAPPRLAQGLLRRRREGRRHRGTCARPARAARVRAEADRQQRPRRA